MNGDEVSTDITEDDTAAYSKPIIADDSDSISFFWLDIHEEVTKPSMYMLYLKDGTVDSTFSHLAPLTFHRSLS